MRIPGEDMAHVIPLRSTSHLKRAIARASAVVVTDVDALGVVAVGGDAGPRVVEVAVVDVEVIVVLGTMVNMGWVALAFGVLR